MVIFNVSRYLCRRYSSALYITGDKAQNAYAVLVPLIDFEVSSKKKLEESIQIRKLSINLSKIEERWSFFKMIEEKKKLLDETRAFIGKSLEKLIKSDPENYEEIEKLKLHLRTVKEDFKHTRELCYGIEDSVVLQVLDLPNILHPNTPQNSELVFYRNHENVNKLSDSHMTIGEKSNYIKYHNPMVCFLKYDAAQFELGIQNYFQTLLLKLDYTQFSNSDFARSVVVEGCGMEPSNPSQVFTMENIHCVKNSVVNRLHLVGAGSLASFMAYFTKHQLQHLPIKLFSIGRIYQPVSDSSKSFFNLSQTSNVTLFTILEEDRDVLDTITQQIMSIYEKLGYDFRVVLIPARKLTKAESLRVSIQMFSNHMGEYVEVGGVSFFDDYLSKRLLVNYTLNNERQYPKIVAGSIVNIHKLLGCVLENNAATGKSLLTDIIKANL
ncbi:serine--tRNA synthetase-like protein Slimp [Cylas formicarius]|uniref:serine--tRNA synthetase-like protein Slimp n=1 Tax=Cylas formicarius TaxID=197179 RepID=UPI0029586382|nr:serine--tRNA synthetase-like protein Slimp [Cylas formicarius]